MNIAIETIKVYIFRKNPVCKMDKPPSRSIVAPKVVLDDIMEFSQPEGRPRFTPRGSADQYIEFDPPLLNSVFDSKGKALYGGG